MRYVLTETKAEKVDLQREVDYLKTYVELQKIRLTEQTKINFSVQGDTFQKQISPLLFINFVENAFKYGVSNEYETHIDISIHIENQSLELRVKNDIVNRFNDLNSNNMGLDNIKLRLDLLYPNKYKLDIENDGEKFIVSLKIKNI